MVRKWKSFDSNAVSSFQKGVCICFLKRHSDGTGEEWDGRERFSNHGFTPQINAAAKSKPG